MNKYLTVNYDEVQKAMEDVKRDRFDYFLDLKTGRVVTLVITTLNEALRTLYGDSSANYDKNIVFDSEVNLEAELSRSEEHTSELQSH